MSATARLALSVAGALHSALTVVVFLLLDLLDALLCVIYRFVDEYLEGKTKRLCYCRKRVGDGRNAGEIELSGTLYGRRNVFREMTCGFPNKRLKLKQVESQKSNDGGRWSDCGCESCVSWTKDGGTQKLHVVVREPPSSSDHLEKIEDSVVKPFQLKSFHIVAHSMGCIIALALAAKYSECVKSITLVAPPYLASSEDEESSLRALEKIAKKRLWPPLMFGAALMSWYEHLGRCVCFLVCRHHRAWEKLVMLLTRSSHSLTLRDVHFMMRDLTRHTHHSAWHTMHNVICGGARCMDELVETVLRSKMKVCVIHGDKDPVVPLECSVKLKRKFWDNDKELRLQVVWNGDHTTVITGREKEFTRRLERIWEDSSSSFDSI
ncbi:Probable lysophospholipase BODYGUARD 4 [Linum perenne]